LCRQLNLDEEKNRCWNYQQLTFLLCRKMINRYYTDVISNTAAQKFILYSLRR
jgi:hypothetical protein